MPKGFDGFRRVLPVWAMLSSWSDGGVACRAADPEISRASAVLEGHRRPTGMRCLRLTPVYSASIMSRDSDTASSDLLGIWSLRCLVAAAVGLLPS